jgi:hypothetical protein
MSNKSEIELSSSTLMLGPFMSRRPTTRAIPRSPLFQQQSQHAAITTPAGREQKTRLLSILDSALAVLVNDHKFISPAKRRRGGNEQQQ